MNRVVITGLGFISPIGSTKEELINSLKTGFCSVKEIENYDPSEYQVKLACQVDDFKPEEYFDKKSIRRLDRVNLMGIVASRNAVEDSGLTEEDIAELRPGVFVSSGIGGLETIQSESVKGFERGYEKISPFFIPMSITNLTAANIAIDIKAQGQCNCHVTACAGSTNSIGEAYRAIKHGYEKVVLAGGAEASICELGVCGFTAMKALHTSSDANRASIPFDKERSGFVMGEGAAVLVLETLDSAKERGAHIYGEIIGYHSNCDAFHITSPLPDGEIASRAMSEAMKEADVLPKHVDYINAHGTSTPLNDKYETLAIKKAFGDYYNKVQVSSSKSQMGHLLGASGAMESIITLLAMEKSFLPATINYEVPDEECDLNLVTETNKSAEIKIAMKNSLGFGGHNAVLLFKKWED